MMRDNIELCIRGNIVNHELPKVITPWLEHMVEVIDEIGEEVDLEMEEHWSQMEDEERAWVVPHYV